MITVNRRHRLEWFEGMTIRDVLKTMNYTYPDIVVRVNHQVILDEHYDDSTIPDEADVRVIHLIAGG